MLDEWPGQSLPELLTLDAEVHARLEREFAPAVTYPRYGVLRHQGEAPDSVYMLFDGWACSSVTLRSGERQLMKVHLPGEMMGLASLCLAEAADTLYALTPVTVRKMPMARFAGLFLDSPAFAAKAFLQSQRERISLMDRVTVLGAKRAVGRLAALLLDLHQRLAAAGKARDDEFVLRMTQDEIGDYLGLTAVHVNRTFRQLEQQGLIARRLQRVRLLNIAALKEASGHVTREVNPECLKLFQANGA